MLQLERRPPVATKTQEPRPRPDGAKSKSISFRKKKVASLQLVIEFPSFSIPVYLYSFSLLYGLSCFPGGSVVKNLPAKQEMGGLIPGSGRSSGEGSDNPIQYSCLENPMDRGAWRR